MLRVLFITVLICNALNGMAQDIPLLKLASPVKGFTRGGTSLLYSNGSSSVQSNLSPSRIEMLEVTDGVIVRADFRLAKYSFGGSKIWEGEIKKEFGLQAMASLHIVSDAKATYILEIKTNPAKAKSVRVTHISPSGTFTEHKFESDINEFITGLFGESVGLNPYIINGDLQVLASSKGKEGQIAYRLYTFDASGNQFNYVKVDFPVDQYERENVNRSAVVNSAYFWRILHTTGDRTIWVKGYPKDVKGKKAKQMVLQLLELSKEGIVSNHKSIEFQPYYADEDRRFIYPTVGWNEFDKSFSVFGLMEIDNKKLNGLYLLKYDYSSGKLIAKHEHPFLKILKPQAKPELDAHYEIPKSVEDVYPLVMDEPDFFVDPKTGYMDLRIITDYDPSGANFFVVKFAPNGEHVQTTIVHYPGLVSYYGDVIPMPTKYQLIWSDKNANLHQVLQSPWELISAAAVEGKKEIFFVALKNRPSTLIKYEQEKGLFSLQVKK